MTSIDADAVLEVIDRHRRVALARIELNRRPGASFTNLRHWEGRVMALNIVREAIQRQVRQEAVDGSV